MSGTLDARALLADFLAEAGELLCDVDLKLVELEREPRDAALLAAIFRGFHTIKGGAGFLKASALVALCHRTETLFDKLRAAELALDAPLMDLILEATGEVRRMFGEMERGEIPDPAPQPLLDALDAAAAGSTLPMPRHAAAQAATQRPLEPDWAALLAAIVPAAVRSSIGRTFPASATATARESAPPVARTSAGSAAARLATAPAATKACAVAPARAAATALAATAAPAAAEPVVATAQAAAAAPLAITAAVTTAPAAAAAPAAATAPAVPAAAIAPAAAAVPAAAVTSAAAIASAAVTASAEANAPDAAIGKAPPLSAASDALATAVALRSGAAATPFAARSPAPARNPAPVSAAKEATLRVDTARFDQILTLSGEIGLTRNRLVCLRDRIAAATDGDESGAALAQAVDQLDTLVGDLQRVVMKARMQPVGRVFQKFVRLGRDLARRCGKEVEVVLEGEDTEVDKTILDELNDPLVHLVRNAVDHGVETPEERAAAGKPARSVVRLAARQESDHIVIAIADDGRGMRPEVMRAKAVEKGVLGADEAALLDDRQSLALIFLPGFSTKTTVTDVSGRGVGMDVVKTQVERLKGRIELESKPGRGTQITVRLPLTLAILPVLVATLDAQPFAIPLAAVREIIAVPLERVQLVAGRPHVVVRGDVLPIAELDVLLGRPKGRAASFGVVVTLHDQVVVLGVDSVLGQDEVMIKPLDGIKARGVAGATVSGEGSLVLVLELQELFAPAVQACGAA